MKGKSWLIVLKLTGVYFLLFHSAPLPLNHDAIGLPPNHGMHAVFGAVLILVAMHLWKKKK